MRVIGNDGLSGSVTSGDFCGIPGNYTLYLPRSSPTSSPPAAPGTTTWSAPRRRARAPPNWTAGPGSAFDSRARSGAGAPGQGRHLLRVRRRRGGQSGRRGPGLELPVGSGAATAEWNGLLGRVAVQGGTVAAQRTFYTALYHHCSSPRSSATTTVTTSASTTGSTRGPGHVQYANLSECRHLPIRGSPPGPPAAGSDLPDGPVTAQRRRPDQGGLSAQVGHRRQRRRSVGRGLGRSDHRRRLRLWGAEFNLAARSRPWSMGPRCKRAAWSTSART